MTVALELQSGLLSGREGPMMMSDITPLIWLTFITALSMRGLHELLWPSIAIRPRLFVICRRDMQGRLRELIFGTETVKTTSGDCYTWIETEPHTRVSAGTERWRDSFDQCTARGEWDHRWSWQSAVQRHCCQSHSPRRTGTAWLISCYAGMWSHLGCVLVYGQ